MDLSRVPIGLALVVSVVLVAGISGVAATAAAGGPAPVDVPAANESMTSEEGGLLADAGLDHTVEPNTTVLLDGTGSTVTDGRIVDYQWRVEPPDSEAFDPCSADDCSRTTFDARAPGTYEVKLSVRDETGDTANDTLYITVSSDHQLSVQVDGPESTAVDAPTPIVAAIATGEATPERIEWYQNGTVVERRSLPEQPRTDTYEARMTSEGAHEFRAVVVDEAGRTASAAHEVTAHREHGDWTVPPIHVEGPEMLTENDSSTATYELTGERMPRIRNHWTEWTDGTGTTLGTGESITVNWGPGRHALRANAYISSLEEHDTVGSDGWREATNVHHVVVDPAPDLSIKSVETTPDGVSGVVTAAEHYSVLTDVTVTVGGEPVVERTGHRNDGRLDAASGTDTPTRTSRSFAHDAEPGSRVSIVATATDDRGQTTTRHRYVQLPASETTRQQMGPGPHNDGTMVSFQA